MLNFKTQQFVLLSKENMQKQCCDPFNVTNQLWLDYIKFLIFFYNSYVKSSADKPKSIFIS